jgi:hypothetical protein
VAAGDSQLLFAEQRIYILALLSFAVMYGLEYLVFRSREGRREARKPGHQEPVYLLHLAGYAAYSALIGYLLVERAEQGAAVLAVYSFAMAVHFVIVNHGLAEEHGSLYARRGHWWLAAAVLGGWTLGAVAPLSDVVFARSFAVLAGGVVITSLKAELPEGREGRFWAFCLGALVFAGLLMVAGAGLPVSDIPPTDKAGGGVGSCQPCQDCRVLMSIYGAWRRRAGAGTGQVFFITIDLPDR